jgi:hypothetical protein
MRSLQQRTLLAIVTIGSVLSSSIEAQTLAGNGRALVLNGGEWYRDLDAVSGTVRIEFPLDAGARWLAVPGLAYAHYTLGSPVPEVDVLVPEVFLHRQLRGGSLRPYIGVGAGVSLLNVIHTLDPVVSLASGLRIDVTRRWGARLEAEVRSFGFEAASVGWSVGIARGF